MREILLVGTGQCGSNIVHETIQQIMDDHYIDQDGQFKGQNKIHDQSITTHFQETSNKSYIPRTLFADLSPNTLDSIRASNLGRIYNPDCFINSNLSSGNSFAVGHYTEGAQMSNQFNDQLRKAQEKCDSFQGAILCHSTGGGCGSGLTNLVIQYFREDSPANMVIDYAVFPNIIQQDGVLEIYNTAFSMNQMIETIDYAVVLDNLALSYINSQQYAKNSFENLNSIIGESICQFTAPQRFPGLLNSSFRKIGVNLGPYPRLHFFNVSYMPFKSCEYGMNIEKLLNSKSMFCYMNDFQNQYYSGYFNLRGPFQSFDFDYKNNQAFTKVDWIVQSTTVSHTALSNRNHSQTGQFIGNSSQMGNYFEKIRQKFSQMFKRRAYMYVFTREGMDEMEFTEVESNLSDLSQEYTDLFDQQDDEEEARQEPSEEND